MNKKRIKRIQIIFIIIFLIIDIFDKPLYYYNNYNKFEILKEKLNQLNEKSNNKNIEQIKYLLFDLFRLKSNLGYYKNTATILELVNPRNNFTLKNHYYTMFGKPFKNFRNETELREEYIAKYRQDLLNGYSSLFGKDFKKIDTIVFDKEFMLGNALFEINNLIYFCEILGCKILYLSNKYWFIKKPIYDKELNITVSPLTSSVSEGETTLWYKSDSSFDFCVKLFNDNFIPVRTYILKDEFLSNVKLNETSENDLYINIRSGEDIFRNSGYSPASYLQPPLCFYQTIIESFNFSNIYIISNGHENPVVDELLKLYNNIKYFHGTIEEDAGMILSAKNLVLPVSSFPIELIKMSNNLQNLFVYDLVTPGDKKFWHFTERHLRPQKFNRFIMNPTKTYSEIMFPWQQLPKQFSQMINEICDKKLTIIPSDFF